MNASRLRQPLPQRWLIVHDMVVDAVFDEGSAILDSK
jgi:hypothetical protein